MSPPNYPRGDIALLFGFKYIHDLATSGFSMRVGFGLGLSVAVAVALVEAGVSAVTEVLAMAGDLPDVGAATFFCSVGSRDRN